MARWARANWAPFAASLVFLAAVVPTLARYGISWDEQTDLGIARSYLAPGGLWAGSGEDPINVRLPMYGTGLLFRWTGPDLQVARGVSAALGAATIWAVWLWCAQAFDRRRGALACLLLATSPYFLGYHRLAFTAGDVYIACTAAWLLATAAWFEARPGPARAVGLGAALGLALSSKISAVAFAPALGLWWLWDAAGSERSLGRRAVDLGTMGAVAVAVFFLVPPVHLLHPIIRDALFAEIVGSGRVLDPAMVAEAIATHFLIVGFRSSPGIGFALWGFAAAAAWQMKRRPELRLPVLAAGGYAAFMCLLPWAQGHYMMPVVPVLAVLAADGFLRALARWGPPVAIAGAAALALLAWDHTRIYPDFNLNGYQWLGERVLAGRATLSARGIAEVRSDGVEQAMRWVARHAMEDDRVLVFAREEHILAAVVPRPRFVLVNGLRHPGQLATADYVVTSNNTQIDAGWETATPEGPIRRYPYSRRALVQEFTRVFSVERAFGLEVAAVWRRNERRPLPELDL